MRMNQTQAAECRRTWVGRIGGDPALVTRRNWSLQFTISRKAGIVKRALLRASLASGRWGRRSGVWWSAEWEVAYGATTGVVVELVLLVRHT